jgi:hypothetical protein
MTLAGRGRVRLQGRSLGAETRRMLRRALGGLGSPIDTRTTVNYLRTRNSIRCIVMLGSLGNLG